MVALSKENINKNHAHLLNSRNIEIVCGDAIHVGAASKVSVADDLCKQLKNGGKMMILVQLSNGEQIFREYVKDENGKVSYQDKVYVRYVPLTSAQEQRRSRLFG